MHRIIGGRIKGLAAVALVVALGAPLASCSSGGETPTVAPKTINIRGDVRVNGPTNIRGNIAECAGAGLFIDMHVGTTVVVASPEGKTLATGRVNISSAVVFKEVLDQCVLQFTVLNVPKAQAYFLLVGRQPAAAVSFAALEAADGKTAYNANPPAVPGIVG